MKRFINFLMLMLALVIAPMTAQADKTAKTEPNVERYNVSDSNGLLAFGKSYYEVDGRPVGANGNYYSTEHPNWSMKGWPNADTNKHVTTYIHFPTCSTNAKIQLTTTGAVTFVVKVYCMEDPSTEISSKTVNISTGTDQWITVMDTKTFSQKAWYKFDIQCTSGAANVGEFKYWQFSNSLSEPAYTADYMSSPSVHLNGWHTTDPSVPSAGRYDWTYQEVMIPEGDDIVGTYCMSLGVLHGYMGIQKDSENDYPIIFSMWDNGSTDNDPNLPDYLRSGALDAGEGVTIARFGGEGTGAQAKFRTNRNWVPGKWVKFLCNARPEIVDVEVDDPDHPGQKKTITYSNTLTSAWVWADGIDTDWRYIATIRQSGANNYMDGWYSFLEDYNWPSGQWKRNAYYRRGGLHSMVTGKWYNANSVGFGHTDGGTTYGDRDDYGHGKTFIDGEEAFYMTSGGYHENVTDTENTLTLINDFEGKIGAPISQTTLTNLLARVDQAIKKEQESKLAEDFENSRETLSADGFTVVYVNSEATNEGDANKKEAAIDGNENTYWHSRWSGGSSTERNYPFYIDIQLSEEMQAKEIEQIAFVFRTGNKSYVPKKLKLQYSSNNSTWTPYSEVYDIADAATSTVNLTTKVTGKKYLRLYFAEGYSDCLAIKEIYFRTAVGRDALNAQVQAILDKENRFDGYSTSDLAALKTAFNSGNWTDAQVIKAALSSLASTGTLLKYGVANGTNALSSFKAYQLYNAKGLGDLIVKTTPAVAADNDVDVTDLNNNWQLLRSEKWNAYYLYNSGAQKYLAFNNGTATLTDKPTPVYVGTRSHNETVNNKNVTVFDGFTFQFDPADANSFLTAPAASASVRGMNKVAPANTCAVTLGASNTDGAVWQLRDNYGVTPSAVSVNELLENVEENGLQPWTRPQFGGTVWTWNKTTNKFEATGKESTATPDRENNHGPVYTFPAGVGTVTTAVNSNTDTSDQGGFRILGAGDNVTTSLGRWAGSIEVATGAVATVEYSNQLKGTEPASAATVWVDGTLNFKSSRTNFNMNDGNAQRWYIGENGKINTSFTQVTKSGDRTWNLQIIVADEPLLPGKVLVPQEFTREVMTWASDIYSNINSCTVYHKDSEGYYHEVETPQITHTATGLSVTYTAMVNADPEPTGTRDLTYNFVHAGQTWASEQHAGANVGSAYPEISTTLPWGVVAAKPEGTVKADDDAININVVLNADYPVKKFVSTYDANGVFMKMGVNAKKQYCYANNTTFASSDNYDENNEAYRWQFVGNPFVGYTIYNKAGGKLYTPNNNTNPTISTTGETKWNFQASDADSKGFFLNIHGDNSKWINRNGGNGTMAFTNQWRDAGSTFYTFAIEQATVHFQNLNTKKWVSYNANAHASNVYNDVVILAQHEANEAQATEFTLTGSSAEGYKISCNANGTTKYVYAINKDDANSNVGFTNDANTATLWKIQQTYRDGNGVDYFNIIPTGGERSWNARGTVNGVATVGQWNAGTATGGNPGSLWRIVSTQTEDITVTYHVTYGGVEKQTINQQTKKGSFYPSISGVPYGLNYTVPSGIVSADAEVTVGTTLASNYPVAPAATVGELTDANYFVMDINSDSHAYIHADGNSVQAHSETPSTVADIVKYQWAFVGNPFDGYSIYNKVGGTSKTLGASYALENGNAAKWKIVSGTASSFRVSPASSSGTYVSLSGNALANSTTTNNATNLRAVQATTWEQNFTKEYRIAGVTERPADLFSDMTLWYKTSAISTGVDNVWMEYSLPIGNGLFGASLYGNVKKDMVTFVDKTLWKKPANNYGSYQYFGELYAESLEEESLMGYNDETAIRNYVRYLDLDAGKAGVSYEDKNGGKYTHEYIASNPDNAIAIRYTASNGATINRRFTLVSGQPGGVVSNTTYAENGGYFGGKMEIESFNARFKVVNTGSTGTVTTTNEGIEVRGANEVLVILAGGTDYDITSKTYVSHTDQLPTTIANRVNDAAGKSWETLYTTHKTDYDKYYTACQFNIGGENTMDTESLVKNYNGDRAGASDLMLEQLYFAYGRYLSISSSRGADIPNNLQGIWANKQDLPWHSDIHTNINVQMNYWPVETTNLSDMHVPFLNQMIYETDTNIHNGWTQMAKNSNQQRGWTLFTESNIYGGSSSFQTNYVIANAWYVTHLWQHYRYTLDEEFLRKAFPAMLSCSQFWMDRLKLVNGKYLAPNEWSPEQGPNQDGVAHAQQLVRELFDNTIAAVGELDAVTKGLITAQDWEDLQERRQNLDLGLDIETYGGAWGAERNGVSTGANILREWKESPYTTGEAGHRHHSHLMCLYPFSQFTEGANGYTPEQLYEAALNSLKLRGDASTGWSMGWKMNLWARALDGDHTHVIIKNALRHSTSYGTDQGRGGIYYNLFDSHAPFQIDGNFGATAGMAECILQSHTGVINLLPALPAVWANGSMKGMKAVGNFTVNQEWADKKLTKATITSHKGQSLKVKSTTLDLATEAKITVNGTLVTPTVADGVYTIDCPEGGIVEIVSNDIPEEPAQTFVFKNKQKGTYAYYDASKKNNDDILVSLGSETDATKFQLDGNETNGYKIKYVDGETTHFVKYQNEDDANYNVVFTDNETEATSWKIVQTYVQDGKIYYNILVSDASVRGWNARGEDSKPSVGFWNKGTNMGGNDGSLWQVIANPGDAATVTYTYTLNGEMAKTETYNVTKGSFMPKYNLPYGITTTEAQPTGYVAGNISKTIACSYIENYPIIPAKSASSITNYYYLGQHSSTKASWHYTSEGSNNVVASGAKVENDSNYLWAFVGNPFTGYQIVNKAAGTTMTLRSNSAPYVLETSPSKNTWMIANATEKGFFLSPAGGSGYINLQSGLLQNYGSADDGSTTVAEAYLAPGPEAVEIDHTISPAEGNVVSTDLTTIAIKFAEEYTEQGVGPYPAEEMSQPVVYPTLTRQGGTPITATAIEMNDDTGFWEFTFPQDSFAEGSWTLNIPQGTFYVTGEFNMETEDIELIPIKAITATYNVVSGEVIATLTINGEEIDYHKNDAEIVLNDSQAGLTKVVIPNDVDNVNVTYTREFKNTNSQPWYVPFDITVPDGFTFYNIWTLKVDENTGVATAVVSKELSSGETIMANTPYIVKANKAGTYNFKSDALKATVEGEDNDETWCATTELIYHFYGSYTSFDLSSKPCYYMSAGTFYYATTTTTLRPYRFYLVVGDKETNTPISPADLENAGAGSKLQIIILGDEEDLPTGIGSVIAPSKNDIHFDLMGRKVNGNVSGLQILNGEKILVK